MMCAAAWDDAIEREVILALAVYALTAQSSQQPQPFASCPEHLSRNVVYYLHEAEVCIFW